MALKKRWKVFQQNHFGHKRRRIAISMKLQLQWGEEEEMKSYTLGGCYLRRQVAGWWDIIIKSHNHFSVQTLDLVCHQKMSNWNPQLNGWLDLQILLLLFLTWILHGSIYAVVLVMWCDYCLAPLSLPLTYSWRPSHFMSFLCVSQEAEQVRKRQDVLIELTFPPIFIIDCR